ncbi:MAG: hypothetical protein HKL80_12000 [Acidimicrobiales bacterium]|nr:hypothetical protein [Acidimicrobiales bacterium]
MPPVGVTPGHVWGTPGHEIDPFYPPFPSAFSNLIQRSFTAFLSADECDFI